MKKILHKADERGKAEFGWLHSRHSFSFGNYFDPDKINFGLLRVFNDDIVEPGQGFGTHPHNDMEIISIVLKGKLEHKDSMGNGSVINEGDVQVMSAGTGVTHSEFDPSPEEKVNFLQIWIFPNKKGLNPRYDQKNFNLETNKLIKVVSGEKLESSLFINQNANIYRSKLDKNQKIDFNFSNKNNGAYLFVLEGSIKLDNELLNKRDAIGIYDTDNFSFIAEENSEIILIEVPMS